MIVSLYDSGLVRRLKHAAKERIRRNRRTSVRGRWWKGGGSGRTTLWWLWLLANAVRLLARPENAAQLKACILSGTSLALAGVALGWARTLGEKLTTDGARIVLLFHPISDRDFFGWASLRFVARSLWILVAAAVIYFLTNDAAGAEGWILRIAAPFAEWLVVLCAVFALARHADKYPRWMPVALYITSAALLLAPDRLLGTVRPLSLALPTGWLHLFMTDPRAQKWRAWVVLGALGSLSALFVWLWNRLQLLYCKEEGAVREQQELAAERAEQTEDKESSLHETELQEELELPVRTAALPMQAAWRKQTLTNWGEKATEYIWQRDWLRLWNWEELPPVERLAGWCLNQREKGEAQFLLGPKPPAWSERWKAAVISTAVAFAVMMFGLERIYFLAVLSTAVAVAVGLPVLGGNWPATNQGRISGKLSPIFGCYPLSYWKAGWTMFKLNAVRTAAWVPLGLLLGALNARSTQASLGQGCWTSTKAVLLFLMVMPILLAGKFSKVTNDTSNLRLRLLPFVAGIIFIVIALTVLALIALLVVPGLWALPVLAAIGLVSWGSWAAYGWYYDRAQVDLLRERQ